MGGSLAFLVREFSKFIRIETCSFITGMAVFGHALFNEIGPGLLYLIVVVFSICAVGYGCNQITDKKEDIINNKKLNFFATGRAGIFIVLLLAFVGGCFALLLPPLSLVVCLASIPATMVYSFFRIKTIFIVKNLYTGLNIALAFLAGALNGSSLTSDMAYYFLFVFAMGVILNLLGDIRGYEGDMKVGLKTLPIVMGVDSAKVVVYSIIAVFLVSALLLNVMHVLFFAPFLAAISLFLRMNLHKAARYSLLSSFPMLSVWIFMITG